jgi:hypothetical protein
MGPPDATPPTTTEEQNLTFAGQRKVNLIWEYTQAAIAILVVGCTMAAGLKAAFAPAPGREIPTILGTGFGLVVGFYFSRTNHSAIGGIGDKPKQEYQGR